MGFCRQKSSRLQSKSQLQKSPSKDPKLTSSAAMNGKPVGKDEQVQRKLSENKQAGECVLQPCILFLFWTGLEDIFSTSCQIGYNFSRQKGYSIKVFFKKLHL